MDLYEKNVLGNVSLSFLITVSGSGRDNIHARVFYPDMMLDSEMLRDIKYGAGLALVIDGHLKLVGELTDIDYISTDTDVSKAIYERGQACLNRYGYANKQRQVLFDKLKDSFPGLKELDEEPDEYVLVNIIRRQH